MAIAIRHILFPTDFSEPANEARLYAVALADLFEAELHIVHIVLVVVPYADASSWYVPECDVEVETNAAGKQLAQSIDPSWCEHHSVRQSFIVGFAVDEILNYATTHEIDLIVIGTHGRSGLSHLLIGSVAEKVVRSAHCPVLTVHPTGHQFVIDSAAETLAQVGV